VGLSLTQKQNFYHELGERLRSGAGFGSAVRSISEDTGGKLRKFAEALIAAAARGDTVAEAFSRQQGMVGDLEVSILNGCERSGRLETGCRYLSGYFQTLAESRNTILKGVAYPVFLLHFSALVFPLKALFTAGGFPAYMKAAGKDLLTLYAGAFFVSACIWFILRLARETAWLDRLLRLVPLFGKVRRAFSLGRFCGTYEMQLQSGVNVMDSLTQAGKASQSALVMETVRRMLPAIRAGEQVGSLLGKTGAFTKKMTRAIKLGEETGKLDDELKRLTEDFHKEALARVETLSAWIPKILYLLIAGFVGYQIITFYASMLSNAMKATE